MTTRGKVSTRRMTTQQLTTTAVLAAIAAILFYIEFGIPFFIFYKWDLSNLPVLLGTFSMGAPSGIIILFIKSLTGLLHSGTGGVGELADFIMGLAMVLPASMLYQRHKCRQNALVGMVAGSVAATVAGALTNAFLLIPMLMPVETVVGVGQSIVPWVNNLFRFILVFTVPFNVIKWVVITALTYFIYKPLSPILHGMARSQGRASRGA